MIGINEYTNLCCSGAHDGNDEIHQQQYANYCIQYVRHLQEINIKLVWTLMGISLCIFLL